jgi:hypothetical protein
VDDPTCKNVSSQRLDVLASGALFLSLTGQMRYPVISPRKANSRICLAPLISILLIRQSQCRSYLSEEVRFKKGLELAGQERLRKAFKD